MLTKEQLLTLPAGTEVVFTGEDCKGMVGAITAEGTILWPDGVESHFGYRSVPTGTLFSVEVQK